jgi:hypothetical protein
MGRKCEQKWRVRQMMSGRCADATLACWQRRLLRAHRTRVWVSLASPAHRRVVSGAHAPAAGRRLEWRRGRRLGGRRAKALARAGRRADEAVDGGARAQRARLEAARRRARRPQPAVGTGTEALRVALAPAAVAGAAGGDVHRSGSGKEERAGQQRGERASGGAAAGGARHRDVGGRACSRPGVRRRGGREQVCAQPCPRHNRPRDRATRALTRMPLV